MTDAGDPKADRQKDARARRLAEALRANLHRRKTQVRELGQGKAKPDLPDAHSQRDK